MKVIVNSSILTQMLLILVSFLCHATKSTTRKNYENGISWDGQFFSESGIKISIAFGIRDQNFDLNNGIIHEKLYLVTQFRLLGQ